MENAQSRELVGPDGRPLLRPVKSGACLRCGASPDEMVSTGGFGGAPRKVCRNCGFEPGRQ